jgi:hypothetical protein
MVAGGGGGGGTTAFATGINGLPHDWQYKFFAGFTALQFEHTIVCCSMV